MEEDNGDGSMVCTDHPFKNNTPSGGICAFCLQEKLGNLVSSSFPIAVFPASSSSSSPPSFRSQNTNINHNSTNTNIISTTSSSSSSILQSNNHITSSNSNSNHHYSSNPSRILYLLTQKKKKNKHINIIVDNAHSHSNKNHVVFKRSKSTATPFMDSDAPHKRHFWSFLYSHSSSTTKTNTSSSSFQHHNKHDDIDCQPSFDRKVSRSRSVGCGSRSFSGDFFERISTGFGDCTLRRVESQREGKGKVSGNDCIKERVRCGGLFSGFMITSSSSSSSSSSYFVASNSNSNSNSNGNEMNAKTPSAAAVSGSHGRSKSWGWALASPMRAFSKSSSSSNINKRESKNPAPNLGAIPSLLSVRS